MKRLVIDYSETIDRYTLTDTYPLPRVDNIVNKVAQYKVFSAFDIRSAIHQIPLQPEDRPFTAFEVDKAYTRVQGSNLESQAEFLVSKDKLTNPSKRKASGQCSPILIM